MDGEQLAQAFGRVLREAREQRGLTQEALAFETDLDRTYISLLERGLRQPTLSSLFALAAALQRSPSSLVRAVERSRTKVKR